jgi:hypothetical protein
MIRHFLKVASQRDEERGEEKNLVENKFEIEPVFYFLIFFLDKGVISLTS